MLSSCTYLEVFFSTSALWLTVALAHLAVTHVAYLLDAMSAGSPIAGVVNTCLVGTQTPFQVNNDIGFPPLPAPPTPFSSPSALRNALIRSQPLPVGQPTVRILPGDLEPLRLFTDSPESPLKTPTK